MHPIFEQISEIESITPTIESYREKLQRLQKFEFSELFVSKVEDKLCRLAVRKFLLGNLYINFLYLWEPVQKLILSHLECDKEAWSTVRDHLQMATEQDRNSGTIMEDVDVRFKSR